MSRPRWPLIAWAATAIGAAVCLYAVRQADPDLWGYLLAGRLFARHGGPVGVDPFAYTSAGTRWVPFEYGAELALWWSYRLAGATGLLALKCALGGVCLACLLGAFRVMEAKPSVAVPIFLLCASAASRYFLFRPQLFTFALFALFVVVLFRHLLNMRAPLWLLPVAMLLWVNTHGGFVAGLGAIALALAMRAVDCAARPGVTMRDGLHAIRPLAVTLGCTLLTTLANPQGTRLWSYVAAELTHDTNRRFIQEWQPPSFRNDPWSVMVLVGLTALLVFVAVARRREEERRTGPAHAIWALSCVPLVAMAFTSVRHTPLAAIWCGPVIARLGSDLAMRLSARAFARSAWFVLRGLAAVPAILTGFVVWQNPRPAIATGPPVLGRTDPCGAVEFLRAHRVRGHVFTPLWWGSYVSWALYPDVLVSMDGRNISLFPDPLVRENLVFYTDPAADADPGIPLRYATDLLLVPADSRVLSGVRRDPRWHVVYSDENAALFGRSDRAPVIHQGVSPAPAACPAILE